MTLSCPMLLLLAGALVPTAHANAFLGREPNQEPAAPLALLDDLERVIGKNHRDAAERRVAQLEELLRPTFQALPKGTDGGIGPEGVRYSLHRLFVDRHGWFVRGLHTAGESYNSSSPSSVFQKVEDRDLHVFFEDHLGSHGFSLHHVAVMAATLETFVRRETMDRLSKAYDVLDLSTSGEISEAQELEAIDTYMMMYVLGSNLTKFNKKTLDKYRKVIHKVYPTWEETKQWVREVRNQVLGAEGMQGSRTFSATEHVLEAMEDRYGRWQNRECQQLKDSLLEIEQTGSGRVPIENFYKSALDGNWQFSESIEYLQLLGALDDTDSSRLSVIIPNYINAHSNCVASSQFYSVCCIDECLPLMRHIEVEVAAPDASPERIMEIVAALPSGTVKAPRTLSASLSERLQNIAHHHGGVVPLHGRLFMQWMHHAFPRECSYPHVSGTTKPLDPMDWMKQTGQVSKATKETMQWHVDEAQKRVPVPVTAKEEPGDLPWLHEEELFVSRPNVMQAQVGRRGGGNTLRTLMMLAAIFSAVFTLTKMLPITADDRLSKHKHLV